MEVACERGQLYEFEAGSAGLLCVDYQTDFLSERGMCASRGLPVAALGRVLQPSQAVLAAARRKGLFVAHMRESYSADLSDLNAFRSARDKIIGAPGPLGRFLIRGERGTEIVSAMAPRPSEPVIDKAGFNGFHATVLDELLRSRGVSHLLIMGITTQCCISSTLRGAVDHGYFPLVVADCCAAWDEQDHLASLRVIYSENHQFGWVSDSARVLAALGT